VAIGAVGDQGEADGMDAYRGDKIDGGRGEADCGGSRPTAPITVPILRDRFRAVNLAVFSRKMDSFCEDRTVRESLHYRYGGGRSQGRR
jgi:hypothetical protein